MKNVITLLLIVLVLPLYGQGRYDYLPAHPGAILFIGDSITDDCEWGELFGDFDVLSRGVSGNNTAMLLARTPELVRHHASKAFFSIGTNDFIFINKEDDAEAMVAAAIDNMEAILDMFALQSPETKIYIQSVLPVGPKQMFLSIFDSDAKNNAIRLLNSAYEKLCKERGLTYIDIYHPFLDGQTGYIRKDLTSDDLHLNGEGYRFWKTLLEPYMK